MKKLILFIILTIILNGTIVLGQSPCFVCDSNEATGHHSSAFGLYNKAYGTNSFTAGISNKAEGFSSIAIGAESIAFGDYSMALGLQSTAEEFSFAFGQKAEALATQSFAIGRFVKTMASCTFAIGSSQNELYPLENNIPNSLMIGFNSSIPTFFVSDSEYNSNYNGLGNVGIGTSEPAARLQVSQGDIYIDNINRGIIMKSPDGSCWRGTVDNNGQLIFNLLTECPEDEITDLQEFIHEKSEIKIYPNPTENYIKIELIDISNKHLKFELIDERGSVVKSIDLNSTITTINTGNISPGLYYGKVIGEGIYKVEKIIKLK